MVPFLIGKITWHLPGGRYHSPSIITAHRRWGHSHQRLYQCRAQNGQWTYFCGAQPVFHPPRPTPLFSDVHCPTDLPECLPPGRYRGAFGVSKQSVIRSVNKYRAGGVKAFYTPRATRGATVMTPEVTAQVSSCWGLVGAEEKSPSTWALNSTRSARRSSRDD